MEEPRSRADKFSDGSRERDDIVFDFSFDFVDAIDGEGCSIPDFFRIRFRNDAFFCERFDDSQLYIQPSLVFVLVLPDFAHSRARVSLDHASTINESVQWVDLATSLSVVPCQIHGPAMHAKLHVSRLPDDCFSN